MMVTLAECYETAYYREADGYLAKDTNKVWEIWRKYNSEPLVKAALKKIEQAEPILPQLDGNTSSYLLHEVGDILKFSQDERLIAPLIRVLRKPPTNGRADENENLDYLRGTASMLLGWLGGTNAVEPVIEALKDEYWLTRYWAVITLGELKDPRAISHLTELLQDSQEMIRQTAGEALIKISQKDAPINPLYSNPAVANMEAAGALIGMTLEDVWPTMTIIKELENSGNVGDEGSSSGSIDDDLDDIPF
ncbi:HEAT repeat domain-containing protein [Kamptonema animale CS-326]|jgi:HEAT repeat protein|uniref:HEAT repeat domain-containing protein n=1 Tax=Kamptonema animale TaxID=92934 RepID=UPI00232FE53D|nr:HEAT repeat domain-containing protein [Kamptonema animale]MDB9513819.1 HEAT repeat domain-containing protein [Kamptonema animale CS-326]